MTTLHIAPSESAGASLREALHIAGRDDAVLAHRDDLSCGPITSGTSIDRVAWWQERFDRWYGANDLEEFWTRIDESSDRLVVWFARHSARELAFRLAWAWQVGERPYHVIDATGLRVPLLRADGSVGQAPPVRAISIVPSQGLATLLGSESPVDPDHHEALQRAWARLKEENAPFRVVTATGLVSVPLDHFDRTLLDCATSEWQPEAAIVGRALGALSEPYFQVGDLTLVLRVAELVGQGRLAAEGNPEDMPNCRIRLPVAA